VSGSTNTQLLAFTYPRRLGGTARGRGNSESDAVSVPCPPTGVNWVHIVFGAVYSVIMILAIRGGWHFFVLFGFARNYPRYLSSGTHGPAMQSTP
jgi:hypothetical protein